MQLLDLIKFPNWRDTRLLYFNNSFLIAMINRKIFTHKLSKEDSF